MLLSADEMEEFLQQAERQEAGLDDDGEEGEAGCSDDEGRPRPGSRDRLDADIVHVPLGLLLRQC